MPRTPTPFGVREMIKIGSPEALEEARIMVDRRLEIIRQNERVWLDLDRRVEAARRGLTVPEDS